MDLHFSIGMLGLIAAVSLQAISWIWFASKLSEKVDNLVSSLLKIDKEFERRDAIMQRMWTRIDELRDLIDTSKG